MKRYLKKHNLRNYTLFVFGINSALRISDILLFKVSDIQNPDGSIKDLIKICEKKTGKSKIFPFNESIKEVMTEYLSKTNLELDKFLFPSRQGENRPISRMSVHNFLKEAADACGIKENISTHTMRKTWARNIYDNNIKENPGIINTIQKALNHRDSSTTLRYIGISQDDINTIYLNNPL